MYSWPLPDDEFWTQQTLLPLVPHGSSADQQPRLLPAKDISRLPLGTLQSAFIGKTDDAL
jgi:hypothetical protein